MISACFVLPFFFTNLAAGDPPLTLVNPSFETGDLTGWTRWGNTGACSASATLAWAAAGIFSAQIQDFSGSHSCGFYQTIAVEPLHYYTVTARVNVLQGTPQIHLRWVDANGSDITTTFPVATAASPGIQTVTLGGIAPPHATLGRIWFYSTTAGTGNSFIDDLLMTVGAPAVHTSEGTFVNDVPVTEASPRCVSGSQTYGVRLVYAHAVGVGDYNQGAQELRTFVRLMQGLIERDSGGVIQLNVKCTGSTVDVADVIVEAIPAGEANCEAIFTSVVTGVSAAGYNSVYEKYLILYDGPINAEARCRGVAAAYWDDSNTVENKNNQGPGYAIGLKSKAANLRTYTQELFHTFGAVQPGAPGSDGAGHCTDGLDVVCTSGAECLGYSRLDCRHDTYFAAFPLPESYLSVHWNTGGPLNRFLQGERTCSMTDTVGFQGYWYIRHTATSGGHDACTRFGSGTGLVGDWNGDGRDGIGFVSAGNWKLNDDIDGGYETALTFQSDGWKFVAGDWDGDGDDTPGANLNGNWVLSNDLVGTTHKEFLFGSSSFPGDTPVVGDWNGDGRDDIALVRLTGNDLVWHLSMNIGAPNFFDGTTDGQFSWGITGDLVTAGDWDGDGSDEPIAVRNMAEGVKKWFMRDSTSSQSSSASIQYGLHSDALIAFGNLDGSGAGGPIILR